MGRVLTNNFSLQFAREEPGQLGVLPVTPDWKLTEPNGVTNFGATITTVARDPISIDKQRRKGTVTDLDSAAEYDADITLDSISDFIEGFLFSQAVNFDLLFNQSTTTATGYTIPAATVAQAGKLQYTVGGPISLIYAQGYEATGNNGLKELAADVASTDTEITAAGLSAETAPATAILEIAGIRPEEGDLAITVVGVTATLTSGNNAAVNNIDFTTLGLTVGQSIHIGGLTTANQFAAGIGYARIVGIAAGQLDLDKLDSALATDSGAAQTVDLLFGRFIRNVPVDDPDYLEISYQFEGSYPNLGTAGVTEYEYSLGNLSNQLSFNLPLTDKASGTFGFIGTDTEVPTTTQKTGADTPREPARTAAMSTTSDVVRLRITQVDETALTTDFKSMTMTFNNNVSPEKVIAQLGAKYMNSGNFEVDIEAQVLFTNSAVLSAIRNNETVSMDFIMKNDDGSIVVDIPSMTLGGGGKDLPINESIILNTTGQAFKDATLGTSIGVSLFAVSP